MGEFVHLGPPGSPCLGEGVDDAQSAHSIQRD